MRLCSQYWTKYTATFLTEVATRAILIEITKVCPRGVTEFFETHLKSFYPTDNVTGSCDTRSMYSWSKQQRANENSSTLKLAELIAERQDEETSAIACINE